MTSPLLVIDADMLIYKVTTATEHAVDWGNDLWVLGGNAKEAVDLLEMGIRDLKERFDTEKLIFCISGPKNYRKDVCPDYKMNRKATRKPLLYPHIKQHLIDNYDTACEEYLEADDLCGMFATHPDLGPTIIVSDDKDMYTIPGVTYRLGEVTEVSADEAWRTWLIQTLTGDATDGYAGAPSYGPVKANKALPEKPKWVDVVKCFESVGLTEADALRNARLARILHHGEYDFDTKQVTLWEPADGS